jgi:hypothetical protein
MGVAFLCLVELRGLEPLTPCMPCRCATSCATAPNLPFPMNPRSRKQPVQLNAESPRTPIGALFPAGASNAVSPAARPEASAPENKNPPESFDSGGSSGGAEGTRTPDPLHAMQVRYQLRHSPRFPCRSGVSPKQLKYLRTAFPKIPNRAYSNLPVLRSWRFLACFYSASDAAGALADASSPSCRSTTGQSFHRRSSA